MQPYYNKDGITLYHGEFLECAGELTPGSIGAVVCDPPYGINVKSDGGGKLNPWADLCNAAYWYTAWLGKCKNLIAPTGSCWSCLNWRSMLTFMKASCELCWPIESLLVWDKGRIGPGGMKGLRPRYEMVALWAGPDFILKDRSVPDYQLIKWGTRKPHGHPAEKPVQLMEFCIRHGSLPDTLILDPFCGSGTTLIAARNLKHPAIGFEIEERFCELTARRLETPSLTKAA